MRSADFTLEALLDMDDYEYSYPSGHWIKIEARKVFKSSNYPGGIKYSLTLHRYDGTRILGYDNDHKVPGDKIYAPYDHKHRGSRIVRYSYLNAEQLLSDFYMDVDKILEREYEYEI